MQNFTQNIFFGIGLTLVTYRIGVMIKDRFHHTLFNPLLIANILVIIILLTFKIKVEDYMIGAKYINYLLTPATVCLAIPLYDKLSVLKKEFRSIFIGCFAGVLTSIAMCAIFSFLFRFSHTDYVSMLGKSITTPIGLGLSEELHGNPSITVALIIVTGIFGNLIAETLVKVMRIKSPVAKGIAIGTASHVLGTSKAIEMGETIGAMSSLAISVAGLMTVFIAPFFANII